MCLHISQIDARCCKTRTLNRKYDDILPKTPVEIKLFSDYFINVRFSLSHLHKNRSASEVCATRTAPIHGESRANLRLFRVSSTYIYLSALYFCCIFLASQNAPLPIAPGSCAHCCSTQASKQRKNFNEYVFVNSLKTRKNAGHFNENLGKKTLQAQEMANFSKKNTCNLHKKVIA